VDHFFTVFSNSVVRVSCTSLLYECIYVSQLYESIRGILHDLNVSYITLFQFQLAVKAINEKSVIILVCLKSQPSQQ
jgi:hypothetical protein